MAKEKIITRKNFLIHMSILISLLVYLGFSDYIFNDLLLIKGESTLQKSALPKITSKISCGVDEVRLTQMKWKNLIQIKGWAFINGVSAKSNKVYVVLSSKDKNYILSTSQELRGDIPVTFNINNLDLEYCGFRVLISDEKIKNGVYQIGFYIKNGTKEFYSYSDEYLVKNRDSVSKGFISEQQIVNLPNESTDVISSIEMVKLEPEKKQLIISGWAFVNDQDSSDRNVFVVLKSENKTYVFDSVFAKRPDVTKHFEKLNLDLDNSGFKTLIFQNAVPDGKYNIGIYIDNAKGSFFQTTDYYVTKDGDELLRE